MANKCFICSENFKIMISLQQCLNECEQLSVAQILQNLHFLTISDLHQSICCICIAKVQSCFEFKKLCGQIGSYLESLNDSSIYKSITSTPIRSIIQEENKEIQLESLNEDYKLRRVDAKEISVNNDGLNIFENEVSSAEVELQISSWTSYSQSKIEIDVENFEMKNDGSLTESNITNQPKLDQSAKKPYVCDVCNKSFIRSNNLKQHKLIHTGEELFVCDVCNKSFTLLAHLRAHKLTHTGNKLDRYVCDVCDKSFALFGNLRQHKLIHTGSKPFECNICNKSFTQFGNLKRHKLSHSEDRPYNCDICNKSFSQSRVLLRHKIIHTKKPFICNICCKSFAEKKKLTKHNKFVHGSKK